MFHILVILSSSWYISPFSELRVPDSLLIRICIWITVLIRELMIYQDLLQVELYCMLSRRIAYTCL